MEVTKILKWFASSPVASFLRVLLATVLTLAVVDFTKLGYIDLAKWKIWLAVAFTSSAPTLIRWINPQDTAFGIKSKVSKKKYSNI